MVSLASYPKFLYQNQDGEELIGNILETCDVKDLSHFIHVFMTRQGNSSDITERPLVELLEQKSKEENIKILKDLIRKQNDIYTIAYIVIYKKAVKINNQFEGVIDNLMAEFGLINYPEFGTESQKENQKQVEQLLTDDDCIQEILEAIENELIQLVDDEIISEDNETIEELIPQIYAALLQEMFMKTRQLTLDDVLKLF